MQNTQTVVNGVVLHVDWAIDHLEIAYEQFRKAYEAFLDSPAVVWESVPRNVRLSLPSVGDELIERRNRLEEFRCELVRA